MRLVSAAFLWSLHLPVVDCWHPSDIVVASTTLINVYNNPPDRDENGLAIKKYEETSPTIFNYDCQFIDDKLYTIGIGSGGIVGAYDILTKTGNTGGGFFSASTMAISEDGSMVYVGQRASSFVGYPNNDGVLTTPGSVFTTQDAATAIALSSDGTTMFYAEGTVSAPSSPGIIYRIDLTTGNSLDNYCDLGDAIRIEDMLLLGPSKDGSDGMIVVANGPSDSTGNRIIRIDAACRFRLTYPIQGATWSSIAMDVDQTSFWATKTNGQLYQFDIESGGVRDFVELPLGTNDFANSVCIYNGTLSEDRTEPPTPAPSLRNPLFSAWKQGDVIVASDGRPQGSLVSVYSNPPLTNADGIALSTTNISSPVRGNFDCEFHDSRLYVTGANNLVIIDGYDVTNPVSVLTDFSPRGLAITDNGDSVYLGRDDESSIALFSRGNYPEREQFWIQKHIATQCIPRTLELSSDGTTIFYAEGSTDNPTATGKIFRINGETGETLSQFANLGVGYIDDIVLLPPSRDGSDGMLVASNSDTFSGGNRILRLNSLGQQILQYPVSSFQIGGIGLNLDGTSFWAATVFQQFYLLDLDTANEPQDLILLATGDVTSICVYPGASNEGEYTSAAPSSQPTSSVPSTVPSVSPSSGPSSTPTTSSPTSSFKPTSSPTGTLSPSATPSSRPSLAPSSQPSQSPSDLPSRKPSSGPTLSLQPSLLPSSKPSNSPSRSPTSKPSSTPSVRPSKSPSSSPSSKPSSVPTMNPSNSPTAATVAPTTSSPTESPSSVDEDEDDDDDNTGTTANTGNTQSDSNNLGPTSSNGDGGNSYSFGLLLVACIVGFVCIVAVIWACCFLGRENNKAKPVDQEEGPNYYDDPESESLNEFSAFETSNWE